MARKQSTDGGRREELLARRHQSRAEREAQQRLRVVIGTAIVTVVVVLILAGGAIYSAIFEPRQTMAEVEGTTISRREFFQRVNYERFRLADQIESVQSEAAAALSDPETAQFFQQFYDQQLQQLGAIYASVGPNTLENMINERLLVAEAESRGITVTEAEIDDEIRRQMAGTLGAQIEPDVTATAEARAAATVTAQSFTPTPTLVPTAVVVVTTTEELTPTPTLGPTSTPFPTLTPYIVSDDEFETTYSAFLAELARFTDLTEADFRRLTRSQLMIEKLREEVEAEAVVELTEPQIHAAHILIEVAEDSTEETREEAREQAESLLNRARGGEDFAELAAQFSDDTGSAANGGSLDWFGRDRMVSEFADAAFALESPGDLSEVVETSFGFHIIKLLEGPEDRPRPESDIQQDRAQAFTDLLNDLKAEASVNRLWDLESLPDDPFIEQLQNQSAATQS